MKKLDPEAVRLHLLKGFEEVGKKSGVDETTTLDAVGAGSLDRINLQMELEDFFGLMDEAVLVEASDTIATLTNKVIAAHEAQ